MNRYRPPSTQESGKPPTTGSALPPLQQQKMRIKSRLLKEPIRNIPQLKEKQKQTANTNDTVQFAAFSNQVSDDDEMEENEVSLPKKTDKIIMQLQGTSSIRPPNVTEDIEIDEEENNANNNNNDVEYFKSLKSNEKHPTFETDTNQTLDNEKKTQTSSENKSQSQSQESSPDPSPPSKYRDRSKDPNVTEVVVTSGFVVNDTKIITTTRTRTRQVTQEEKDEAQIALDNLLKKRIIPPTEIQPLVLMKIKSDMVQAMIDQDYDHAEELENANIFLTTSYETAESELRKQEQQQVFTSRLESVKKTMESETQEWEQIFNVFQQQQKEQEQQLLKAQNEEFLDFEAKWNDSSQMYKFNKPSPNLIQMRKIQKNLAILKNFGEAKKIKESADALAEEESEYAQKRAEDAMMCEYNALMEKQNREKECFYDRQKWVIQSLKNEQRKVFHPLEMQMKQLQNQLDYNKPTNKRPITNVPVATKTRVVRNDIPVPTSPRTISALTIFKHADDAPKLNVNGLNVRQLISKKRSTSVSRGRTQRSYYD